MAMSAAFQASDVVTITRGDASCIVHLYGATVVSWISGGSEAIFVSSKSHFDNKKAIRGGIPLVFPNFGPWANGPQHGFARISCWTHTDSETAANGDVMAIFTLEDTEATHAMWDFRFHLTYTVTLKENSLHCSLQVTNTGDATFDFTCLLHTYLKVPRVDRCTVSGLSGLTYTDKVKDGEKCVESRELVTVNENVDRVYEAALSEHVVTAASESGTSVVISKQNLPDTVVWNPWQEKACAMADFGDEEYPGMLCVEAGSVSNPQSLAAGQTFHGGQELRLKAKV